MATETGSDLLAAALEYAALGWRIVPLHWSVKTGVCSCHLGKKCPEKSRGKHPRLNAWHKEASNDEERIAEWWGKWPKANVGVVLGEASNLIDIETDDAEQEAELVRLFGGDPPPTCCFSSGRGKHWLFRWRNDLPGGAVVHFGHLGIRTGNDAKGAQSVFPPSIHHSGRRYTWLAAPGDVEPAALPYEVMTKLWNIGSEASKNGEEEREPSVRHKLYTQNKILETTDGRDNVIYAEACELWREQVMIRGQGCFDSPDVQTIIYQRLWAWDRAKCSPPLGDEEVLRKCESAKKFISSAVLRERDRTGPKLTSLGLEFRDGEWWPGSWKVETINSDPPVARLYAPFLPNKFIDLTMEQYDSASEVHRAVLGATGMVCLDDGVLPWKSIWKGFTSGRGAEKRSVRGIYAKLLDVAERIEAPREVKRTSIIAAFLLAKLDRAKTVDDEAMPNSTTDVFRRAGKVMFSFDAVYQSANRDSPDKITRPELSRLCRQVGADETFVPISGGKRRRFMVLTAGMVERLETMAEGRARELPIYAEKGIEGQK